MLIVNNVFLILIYLFDGAFRGAMLLSMAETTAELGYPLGESVTFGFLLAIQGLGTFILNFFLSMLVNPFLSEKEQHLKQQ